MKNKKNKTFKNFLDNLKKSLELKIQMILSKNIKHNLKQQGLYNS